MEAQSGEIDSVELYSRTLHDYLERLIKDSKTKKSSLKEAIEISLAFDVMRKKKKKPQHWINILQNRYSNRALHILVREDLFNSCEVSGDWTWDLYPHPTLEGHYAIVVDRSRYNDESLNRAKQIVHRCFPTTSDLFQFEKERAGFKVSFRCW